MLGLDTDVLAKWAMTCATHHARIRSFLERETRSGVRLAVAPQVCFELIHIVTDPKRFEAPLTMSEAIAITRQVWGAPQTVRVLPSDSTPLRTLELLEAHALGRKRILDTALAATLEEAGVRRLATLNGSDYRVFSSFLDIVDPLAR